MIRIFEILFPVLAVICAGYGAARFRLVDAAGVKSLSDLTFLLLTPPLLFRAMAGSHIATMSFGAPVAYFSVCLPMFIAVVIWRMRQGKGSASAAVFALAATYSNTVMLGFPLVMFAFGDSGLSHMLTIVAVHSLIMLTAATLVLELGLKFESSSEGEKEPMWLALLGAIKTSVLHPVILPIVLGIGWSWFEWPVPRPIDQTLQVLGSCAPTLCLVLLGASLAQFGIGQWMGDALRFVLLKNLALPLGVWLVGRWVLSLEPLPLAVATLAAAMPVGGNVYMFAQRYEVEREAVSAGVLLTTVACALTVPLLLLMLDAV